MQQKHPTIFVLNAIETDAAMGQADIETIAEILRDSGYTVRTAKADSTGLTMLKAQNPPLTILAGTVPASVIGSIRRNIAPQSRILAVVPGADSAINVALAVGADDCLVPPIFPALLRKRVSLLLRDLLDDDPVEVYDENAYRTIFDRANDAIFIEDLKRGKFLDVNRRAAQWLGYTRDELLQMRFRDIRATNERADSQEVKRSLTTRGQLIFEDTYQTRNGRVIPVEVSSRIVYFNGNRAIASFARDISERKAIQSAEREQRALAEALAGAAAALSGSLQFDDIITEILRQVKRVVPSDAANIMLLEGQQARIVGHQGYEGRPAQGGLQDIYDINGLWVIGKILETGKPLVLPDVRDYPDLWTVIPDGSWISSYLGAPIQVEDEIIGFLSLDDSRAGYFNNAHLEKLNAFTGLVSSAMRNALLYKALQQHAEQLDTRVKQRTAELVQANDELVQEIEDRKKAEIRLADERNLLRTLVDNLPDHIYVKDRHGRLMLLNAAAVDALKQAHSHGELNETSADVLAGSEHITEIYEQEQAIMRGEVGMQEVVERTPDYANGDRWLLVTKIPLYDHNGAITGMVGINRDITPLKEAEVTLKRSNRELERRVQERTAELEELAEAERAQRRMAEALHDSITALTETLALDTVLDRILKQATRVVPPHDVAGILLIQPDNRVQPIRVRVYEADRTYNRAGGTINSLDALPDLRRVMETGSPLIASTARDSDPPLMTINPGENEIPLRSFVLLPITVRGRMLGFLRLGSRQPDHFSEQDITYLKPFTDQAGVAIQNAQLFEKVQTYAATLRSEVEQRTADLNRERRLLRAILDALTEGVVFLDGNFQPRFANYGFEYISGYTAAELETGDMFFRAMNMDRDMLQMIEQTLYHATNGEAWHGELRLKHRSGHEYDAAVTATAISGTGYSAGGIVVVIRNISEEKRLALQKAQFIANASHELRTPITNLKTRLYLISRQPEKSQNHIEIMERVTERMSKLVEDLLDASRFERGKITLQHEYIDARELARSVVQTQLAEAETRQIALREAYADEPLIVHVDPARIIQVLTNLVANAINYIQEGATITVRVQPGSDSETVEYHVEDNGPGIPESIHDTLFMPFVRGTEERSGSGLGLSISRDIIELHDGTIDFTSVEGEGTIFTVSLPRDGEPDDPD